MNNRSDPTRPAASEGRGRPAMRCRVCLKPIRAEEVHSVVYHAGASYQVCCASCAAKFEANPGQYLVG